MNKEEKIKSLLISILRTLSEAATEVETDNDTDCGTLHYPVFRYTPSFEFTDDDIQLIKELGEEALEDFSTMTEFYNRINITAMNETNRIYYAWIARDKSGTLRLFNSKPVRFKWFGEWSGSLVKLNPEDFPDVTWENSPQQVELIIRKRNEQV